MTISELNLSIYEVLIHKLELLIEVFDILRTGHLPKTLISPTQLMHMLDKSRQPYRKQIQTIPCYFLNLYYYYDMKAVSFGYDKDLNLVLQFPAFIESYTQKPLALYQVETVPVPFKDNNTEANSHTWLQPRKDYFTIMGENYISLTSAEL